MWSKSGFLARILRHLQDLQEMLIVQGELEVTPWHVDTTGARANKAAAGAGKKGARGALGPRFRPVSKYLFLVRFTSCVRIAGNRLVAERDRAVGGEPDEYATDCDTARQAQYH